MRALLVFSVLLLLMRFGADLVPAAPFSGAFEMAVPSAGGPGAPGGATVGSLAVAFALGVLPLIGFFSLFRSFGRWHRSFHARMQAGGLPLRPRGRGR